MLQTSFSYATIYIYIYIYITYASFGWGMKKLRNRKQWRLKKDRRDKKDLSFSSCVFSWGGEGKFFCLVDKKNVRIENRVCIDLGKKIGRAHV